MAKKKTTSARPAAKAAPSNRRRPEPKKAGPQTERAKTARPAAPPKAAQPAPRPTERPKAAQPPPTERPKVAPPAERRSLAVPAATVTPPLGQRPGRNEPCYCGSGRKYKHCHLNEDEARAAAERAAAAAEQATAPAEPASAAPPRPLKHETHQPWKGATSRGFVPRARTPRKVGGS
jgi:hypothetical protein